MQKKTELKKYFAKELGQHWYRQYQSQAIFDFLMNAASFCKNGVILDAGAGRQRYKPFFENCIYISQEHEAGISLKNMQNVEYDIISPLDEKIPFKDNTFDGVLSTSVLEHIRYPDKFISEAYRVLKPGGKLFVNCPFCYPEHEEPFDFNRPSRFGLERWFKDAGFAEIAISPTSSCTETVCNFFAFAIWNDIRKSSKTGKQIIDDLIKIKGRHTIVKIIVKIAILSYAKFSYILARAFCFIIKFLIDKGPHSETNFPVGWIAVATKPGERDYSLSFKDKGEFLANCKL